MTIRDSLRSAAERLELHYVSNPRLTAELLLAHALSVQREYLYAYDERILTKEETQKLEDLLYDRIGGVPLQYIVGRQEFYGRYFHVNPSVLIPRPETEHMIEAVLETHPAAGAKILDVGTGSGCIGVTLALEIPGSKVFATDISEPALKVARENAAVLDSPVSFVCMDFLDAIGGRFEYVVSNPPYVRPEDINRLQREVREHEPHVALFSPNDEADVYRRLMTGAERLLVPGGYLMMEVGIGMDERVLNLFGTGWKKLPTKADLQGIPRTVILRREGAEIRGQ